MTSGRIIAVWLILLALALWAQLAEAQPSDADRVALVGAWVAESGWHASRDHAIQAHVLTRWAGRLRLPFAEVVDRRVWRWRRPAQWVRNVGPSCEQPDGWPRRYLWGAHADDCRVLFAMADSFFRGEVSDPCPAARGWRMRGWALEVALGRGRRLVRCGRTVNAYVR